MDKIEKKIEELQKLLIDCTKCENMQSDEILEMSRELDIILNSFIVENK